MHWKTGLVILPTIPGSAASGAVIRGAGWEAAHRGTRFKLPDGTQVRPDLLNFDDVQSDEIARNPNRIRKGLEQINKMFRLGGHGYAPTGIFNATVIAADDIPDQLASKKYGAWQAVRSKTMPTLPLALETHWLGEYKRIRHDYDPEADGDEERAKAASTEYYRQNREVMDAGASTTWQSIPIESDEISAIQHAMNVWVDDGQAIFESELQNSPKRLMSGIIDEVDPAQLRERVSGFDRGCVPDQTAKLVAMIDVHDAILYWSVVAARSDFTGFVVDYGTYPEQPNNHFAMHSLKRKLQDQTEASTVEEGVVLGVKNLINELGGREWLTPNHRTMNLSCLLVDFGYLQEYAAKGIRLSDYRSIALGSRGVAVTSRMKPIASRSRKNWKAWGPNPKRPRWYVDKETIDGIDVLNFDANWFKTISAARWMQGIESPGAWSIFGNDHSDHSHYSEQLTAEYPDSDNGFIVWKVKPNRENHWGDTDIGCKVAASYSGVVIPGDDAVKEKKKKRRPRGLKVTSLSI